MSQFEDVAKQHCLPPPSYDEAVFGITSANKDNDNLPNNEAANHTPSNTLAAHYSRQQLPATHYNSQHYTPQYNTQPYQTPYTVCPPGADLLLNLDEILVYPSKGRIFKIRDKNKTTIMTVKFKWAEECCNCCNCENYVILTLRTVPGEITVACANLIIDSLNCCSYSKRHLEIQVPLEVIVGNVRMSSNYRSSVENQSGDVLYELQREKSCCEVTPYQITTKDGRQVGQIDHSRGIKHRLTLPKEMPVKHKISLLFFSVALQAEADSRRRSN